MIKYYVESGPRSATYLDPIAVPNLHKFKWIASGIINMQL